MSIACAVSYTNLTFRDSYTSVLVQSSSNVGIGARLGDVLG